MIAHKAREHEATRLDIENLRLTLEQEQMFRKRKQEYDVVAEKINDYPSRAELTAYVPKRVIFRPYLIQRARVCPSEI